MSRIEVKCSEEFLKEFVAVLPGQFIIDRLKLIDHGLGYSYDITLIAPDELTPGFYECQFATRPTGFSMDFVRSEVFSGTGNVDAETAE